MVTDLACAVVTILAIALLILSLSMLINKPEGETSREVVVRGHFGSVQGVRHTVLGHTDVYTFLGVPYAHPPLGDLRFRRSFLDSDTSLSLGLEIDATSARPACVQSSSDASLTIVSEDCLHLNIWTPTKECTHASCADKPVLVFLHGGSFQTGGNAHPLYDGRYLSAFGDAVIVVPNYRLGAMGFLNAGSANAPGNVGLDDQLVALQWTRKNIGSFGGNASNMVLVGYGAGAAAAGYLLFASAAGTVDSEVVPRRAILMSGSPFTRYSE
ncbi:hypothetical protein HPB48_017777 [Haemaphysalis longicornis]|uniref:Carboxylesterase type B domain-containing protein n=1 Tax=Haemaphysalis longicornis TaxID=44386 RepID=A0A9J6G6G1_HAELO|nr:hypothetical protein HPB48_017777 [Haemaphysalis longicornis]